jgi:hypothetical protein
MVFSRLTPNLFQKQVNTIPNDRLIANMSVIVHIYLSLLLLLAFKELKPI